jgi:hypothetical protein
MVCEDKAFKLDAAVVLEMDWMNSACHYATAFFGALALAIFSGAAFVGL